LRLSLSNRHQCKRAPTLVQQAFFCKHRLNTKGQQRIGAKKPLIAHPFLGLSSDDRKDILDIIQGDLADAL
jgi:phage gpG-like protein